MMRMVLTILGGWFLVSVVASLILGRMMALASSLDAPDAAETPAPASQPTSRDVTVRRAA